MAAKKDKSTFTLRIKVESIGGAAGKQYRGSRLRGTTINGREVSIRYLGPLDVAPGDIVDVTGERTIGESGKHDTIGIGKPKVVSGWKA